LRFSGRLNFGEDDGSLVLETGLHTLVIPFGVFPGAVFELKIAEIVIDGVAALQQLIQLAAMWR
jgi:hypothetical protein